MYIDIQTFQSGPESIPYFQGNTHTTKIGILCYSRYIMEASSAHQHFTHDR